MERTKRSGMLLLIAVIVLFVFMVPAEAANTDAKVKKLEKQMAEMQKALNALKAERAKPSAIDQQQVEAMVTEAMSGKVAPDWISNVLNFEGELRYQHVDIDDGSAATGQRSNDLYGFITVYGAVNDETDLILRVATEDGATAKSGEDKDIFMELMYFDWHPDSLERLPFIGTGLDLLEGITPWYRPGSFDGAHLLGGRIPYPFYHPVNSNIAFDGPDLDGGAITMKNPIGDNIEVFGGAFGAWLDERATDSDASLWGTQLGFTWLVPDMEDTYATMAVAYFDYGNVEGAPVNASAGASNNTITGSGNTAEYVNDYNLFVVNGEITFPACPGIPLISEFPVTLFGEIAENMGATSADTDAWLLGVSLGEIANPGDWQFVYNYRRVGKDATFDSQNAGFGVNTDVTGSVLELAYKLAKNCSLAATYENGRQNVSTSTVQKYDALTLGLTVGF